MRQCTKCGIVKYETEFYSVTERGITRLRRICKECSKAQQRDHSNTPKPDGRICTECGVYKVLTEFHKHTTSLYGVEPICKLCRLEQRRAYNRRYPERIRNIDLKVKYGITIADYEAMAACQGGKCAICGVNEQKLVVDHNHQTGEIRALLCHLCNTLIGCARENIAILVAATAYLYREQHPEQEDAQAVITFA